MPPADAPGYKPENPFPAHRNVHAPVGARALGLEVKGQSYETRKDKGRVLVTVWIPSEIHSKLGELKEKLGVKTDKEAILMGLDALMKQQGMA